MLSVIQTGETRNMIDFLEIYSSASIYLMKTDFLNAVQQLKIWRENQSSTDFSSLLFNMFCKADIENKKKFLLGFPAEMTAYLLWYHSDTEAKFFEKYENIKIADPETNETENDDNE